MNIRVFVDGIPKGQPRVRGFATKGRVRMYTPGTAEAWKGAIALAVKPFRPAVPYEGAVHLHLAHVMPRPKNHYRTGRNAGQLRSDAPTRHTSVPDSDNLLKAAMDALTTVGVWRDDDQVDSVFVSKSYGERPGALLVITGHD